MTILFWVGISCAFFLAALPFVARALRERTRASVWHKPEWSVTPEGSIAGPDGLVLRPLDMAYLEGGWARVRAIADTMEDMYTWESFPLSEEERERGKRMWHTWTVQGNGKRWEERRRLHQTQIRTFLRKAGLMQRDPQGGRPLMTPHGEWVLTLLRQLVAAPPTAHPSWRFMQIVLSTEAAQKKGAAPEGSARHTWQRARTAFTRKKA